MQAMGTWLDMTAGNIANLNDAVPAGQPTYQQQEPILAPVASNGGALQPYYPNAKVAGGSQQPPGAANGGSHQSEGVAVVGVALGSSQGMLAYEPGNPLANGQQGQDQGMVAYPAISLGSQLVNLLQAQVGMQANVAAVSHAAAAYQSLINMA